MTRRNSRLNPKASTFTPEQEAEYQRTGNALTRAQIYQYGVAQLLTQERPSTSEAEEASRVLSEAVAIRKEAFTTRAGIRAENETANPARKKRTPKRAQSEAPER